MNCTIHELLYTDYNNKNNDSKNSPTRNDSNNLISTKKLQLIQKSVFVSLYVLFILRSDSYLNRILRKSKEGSDFKIVY